jgi:hypothetical protein
MLIKIGTVIKDFGKVVAVGWIGERYYWLIKNGVVSMIPASTLEAAVSYIGGRNEKETV